MLITIWYVHSLAFMVVHKWGWAASWDGFIVPQILNPMLPTRCLCPLVSSEQQDLENVRLMLDDLALKGGPATSDMCGPVLHFPHL